MNNDRSTRQEAVKRLVLLMLTALFTIVPLTVSEVMSMLKAVMFEAALIKTVPIAVVVGTEDELNATSMLLMIDPLLNLVTVKWWKETNAV